MSVLFVSYEVSPEHVADVETGVKKIIAALERQQPAGVRYAMAKRPGGVGIVGLLALSDGADNLLLNMSEAKELQHNLTGWVVGDPPRPQPLEVIGSYNFPGS